MNVLTKLRLNATILVALFVVTMALYCRAAYFPFCVIDDNDYVTINHHVTSGLSADSIKWAFTAFHASNWHPLTWLSLMLDSQLFGVFPMGFHLVNVVLHAVNTSLLFYLLNSMSGAVWRSAFVAACFGLHPLHVESVAWIAERKDVLSTLFWILTLLYYSDYVKQGKRSRYFLSLAMFALGLMAKQMLVTIPLILLLLDVWPLERLNMRSFFAQGEGHGIRRLRALLLEKIPFILLAMAAAFMTVSAQKPSMSTLTDIPLAERVANALWALLLYVEKMFIPCDLSIFYPLVSVPLWKAGLAGVLLCAAVFIVLKQLKGRPYLAFGWFWYLISVLPVLGLIQVGTQSMADRYTYVPLIGLFVMVGWGGAELCGNVPKLKKMVCLVAIGSLLFFSWTTWRQLSCWHDNMSLILHAVEVTENNSFAHFTLGLMYEEQGMPSFAYDEYMKIARSEPLYPDPQYHNNFGCILAQKGMLDDAVEHFNYALRLAPKDKKARVNLNKALELKRKAEAK